MCIATDAVVERVEGATAVVRGADGVARRASLAPLMLDGVAVAPGDRVLVELGLAIERLGGDG
jgi:hydrogenase maturation factor